MMETSRNSRQIFEALREETTEKGRVREKLRKSPKKNAFLYFNYEKTML
jgi:hypothetical protein